MIPRKIEAKDIHRGTSFYNYNGRSGETSVHVLGAQFGPMLLAVDCTAEEALEEFTDRHCEGLDDDLPALEDYEGDTIEEKVDSASNAGDLRHVDGSGWKWVDHYEWIRSFRTVKEAGQFFRNGG